MTTVPLFYGNASAWTNSSSPRRPARDLPACCRKRLKASTPRGIARLAEGIVYVRGSADAGCYGTRGSDTETGMDLGSLTFRALRTLGQSWLQECNGAPAGHARSCPAVTPRTSRCIHAHRITTESWRMYEFPCQKVRNSSMCPGMASKSSVNFL